MEWSTAAGSLTLALENGSVVSLVTAAGEAVIAQTGAPLFEVVALDAGNDRHVFRPRDGREQPDGSIAYDGLYCGSTRADFAATLIVSTEADGAWSVRVHLVNNDAAYTPVEIVCLQVHGLRLGGDAQKNVLLYPHHAGERIVNPAQTMRSERYRSFWRGYTALEDGLYVRENNYCGLMSMSWMFFQAEGVGLYFGSHDARFPVTGLRMVSGGEDWMGFGFRVHHRIDWGEGYQTGRFVLAAGREDWHSGAKRYRAWIDPHLAEHRDPAFLREEAALHQCYRFKRSDGIYNYFRDIPTLFDRGMEIGLRHMFIASWNRTGFDSSYPEYYPDMDLGTALDFRRGLQYVTEHGGFSTLYVNARIFDMKSDFHPTLGEAMAITDEKQTPLTETYAPNTFTLNCPSDETWQHQLVDICDFTHEAYGAQGIYLDQLASAEPFACYHEGHTHANIGDFNRGYLKILSELRQRLWARNPDNYLMTENCGDIYSAYVWANLTWNGADYDEHYNLFRYTFPEFVQVNMVNERAWVADPQRRKALFYSDIERCILMGNIMWVGWCSRFDDPEVKEQKAYMEKAVALRQAISPWIARGTYLDDAYVADAGGLAASCFALEDSQALLLVGNCALQEGGEACFDLPFAPAHWDVLCEEGEIAQVAAEGNRLSVRPSGRLAAVYVRA